MTAPPVAEKDRWVAVGFCAIAIIGLRANEQDVFLRSLLARWFSDVPDKAPTPDDAQAFARYAVKLLLRSLIDDGSDGNRMRAAKELTLEAMHKERAR